jgi:hypothetical protein
VIVKTRFKYEESNVPGKGIPWLYVVRNPKTMHIHWSDGTLWDYNQFSTAIGESLMTEVVDAWKQRRNEQKPRAELSCGGVCGSVVFVTHALGEEILAIVIRHFETALRKIRT